MAADIEGKIFAALGMSREPLRPVAAKAGHARTGGGEAEQSPMPRSASARSPAGRVRSTGRERGGAVGRDEAPYGPAAASAVERMLRMDGSCGETVTASGIWRAPTPSALPASVSPSCAGPMHLAGLMRHVPSRICETRHDGGGSAVRPPLERPRCGSAGRASRGMASIASFSTRRSRDRTRHLSTPDHSRGRNGARLGLPHAAAPQRGLIARQVTSASLPSTAPSRGWTAIRAS